MHITPNQGQEHKTISQKEK